ncbi:MAG: hypothetical protein N2578_07175 [Bdellovibrionaceae bacterium]|nr:hypothetical protein [Pseudobdellovibrionaceae bacterium]
MDPSVRKYLSEIGRLGGKKSRRTLTSEQASAMVKVREARRAYRRFHSQCFWSYDPNYIITSKDVQWVAEQLMKNGDRKLWQLGAKLCR